MPQPKVDADGNTYDAFNDPELRYRRRYVDLTVNDHVKETFLKIFGLGSTKSRAGKEMEAIRAANLLTDNDSHGASWIQFNKPSSSGSQVSGRGGRRGGRRRTA